MKIVGLDLGTVTLGIAISDSNRKIAFSKETWRYNESDLAGLADKTLSYLTSVPTNEVVIGLPRHMNGDIGVSGQRALRFKELLLERDKELKIVMWDERLTTSIALNTIAMTKTSNKAKKRKERVDALAALNILQSYLDSIK